LNARKLTTILTAAALAIAPTAATAATSLSVAQAADVRAAAPTSDASNLNRTASIALGFLILVAIIAVAVSGGDEPDSP
jgi:hypothetical protein